MSYLKQKINNARVKIREKLNPIFAKGRRNKLVDCNFTIISNNCWGGHVYRYYGIRYLTPTIGLYFYTEDFIKFCKNLKYYISLDLAFIDLEESKYKDDLINHGNTKCPIGKLGDVEIIFLHYKTKEEAQEKWNRRKERINWDHILLKLSEQNFSNEQLLQEFDSIDCFNKVIFVTRDYKLANQIIWKGDHLGNTIPIDTVDFRKFINLADFINGNEKHERR